MVRLLLWVPDSHVPEETTICPQDVVRPVPYLPPQPDHAPLPPIPAPGAPSREEMGRYVLQSRQRLRCRYLLLSPISLRLILLIIPENHYAIIALSKKVPNTEDTGSNPDSAKAGIILQYHRVLVTVGNLHFHVQVVRRPAQQRPYTEGIYTGAGWGGKILRSSMINHLILSAGYFC